VAFGGCDKADGNALLAGTTGTSNPMNVDFGIARQLNVDHHVQSVDIQPAGRDIGRDQHGQAAVAEHGQYLITVALFQVAVQRHGRDAFRGESVDQFLALLFGKAEGHAGLRTEAGQDLNHGLHALFGVDFVEALLDLGVVMQGFDLYLLRVAHEGRRELLDAGRVGRREQQGLPLARALPDDLGNRVVEAHVEHAVGFVEDQLVQAVEFQ